MSKRKGYVKVLLTNQLDPSQNGIRLMRERDLPSDIRDALEEANGGGCAHELCSGCSECEPEPEEA